MHGGQREPAAAACPLWCRADVTAIAAPVRNAEGHVAASISASGPSFRIPPDRIGQMAESVRRAAAEVSRRLGWTGSADVLA